MEIETSNRGKVDMMLAGIDLAWKNEKNPTAVSIGELSGHHLNVTGIHPALSGLNELKSIILLQEELYGVAIDAPLVMQNSFGQRHCERQVSVDFGGRGASCHSSNLERYPNPAGVELSRHLESLGFEHLRHADNGKFQIECYPHPAIIEIFSLPKRLAYKKGPTDAKKQGQVILSNYIKALGRSNVISLSIIDEFQTYLDHSYIRSLSGEALKTNEDVLDSIICVYIAALFSHSVPHKCYGSVEDGYIYVPKQPCVN
ncbi:MAG: DUF429 domain-containing protein [Dehalogenimonas sp.]|uniref:DUF429 domain-containing protein n=1 Tax=Candidatus Dehalogenimonas loeffleri TaxID=3127115 RepID=A0ABZ2J7D5_9CHLR|nr:DUF429 domain-containing protein [Dehalogenimonas sp.]